MLLHECWLYVFASKPGPTPLGWTRPWGGLGRPHRPDLGGSLEGGSFEGGNFEGGSLEGGSFEGGNFEGGNLEGGNFEGGNLEGGRFEGASKEASDPGKIKVGQHRLGPDLDK